MKLLTSIATLALVVPMYAPPALAQEPVTFVLRSGEYVSVELIDLRALEFIVRQNGAERGIPFDLVAAIDFIGGTIPDSTWTLVASGRHALWLRSGEVVQGRLYDVRGGARPLRITFDGGDNRREYVSSEVARILLVPPTPPQRAIDLNGNYFAPSSGRTIDGAVASATTHPLGDRRGEGQVYEVNLGFPAVEGTYTPFSDDSKKPHALSGIDLRGKTFQCDVDLHHLDLWQVDAEFFQIGAGRQADPTDTDTEEFFVFIYRSGREFALYMETDWALYRPETTYYSAADETRFRVRVEVNAAASEALLTVIPLDGLGAGVEHTVKPLPLDVRSDKVTSVSFFAGFTQNYGNVNSKAKATLDQCAINAVP